MTKKMQEVESIKIIKLDKNSEDYKNVMAKFLISEIENNGLELGNIIFRFLNTLQTSLRNDTTALCLKTCFDFIWICLTTLCSVFLVTWGLSNKTFSFKICAFM